MMVSFNIEQHEMSPCYRGHMDSDEKERRQHKAKCNQTQNTNLNAIEDEEQGTSGIVWV